MPRGEQITVVFDIEDMLRYQLTFGDYLLFTFISMERHDLVNKLLVTGDMRLPRIARLVQRGYIADKTTAEGYKYELLEMAKRVLVRNTNDAKDLDKFITEYRTLFPPTQRGDKKGCMTKMRRFLNSYPEYSEEQVLTATRNYISHMTRTGSKQFIRQAHYFIIKDGVSDLAGWIERTAETPSFAPTLLETKERTI